jgi:integrase
MASVAKRPDGRWRARYRDEAGREHARHFGRKIDAQRWLDQQTAALVSGMHVAPRDARITVSQWCETWLAGYGTRRASTVRQAEVHIAKIKNEFGSMQLAAIRPSQVKSWTASLKADGAADSYVYALHARLSQIMSDAVHDGVLARNPCSRRTSPPAGEQRPYVATTDQVWAVHDTLPERLRAAVLLGAFVGLRDAEACGLRVEHVDFMRGVVHPTLQYPDLELKSDMSRIPVPIPRELALTLSAHVRQWPGEWVLVNEWGRQLSPWQLQRAVRAARAEVAGLPDGFRFHDLRHFLASMLIASGADVKVVRARLRHASAKTTLDVYGHLWPDADESTRAAVSAALAASADSLRTDAGSAG